MGTDNISLDLAKTINHETQTCDLPLENDEPSEDMCFPEPFDLAAWENLQGESTPRLGTSLELRDYQAKLYADGFSGVSSMPPEDNLLGNLSVASLGVLNLVACSSKKPMPIEIFNSEWYDRDRVFDFVKALHKDLNSAGVKDKEIDSGYYFLGKKHGPNDKLIGKGDVVLHEMELYRSANELAEKNPNDPQIQNMVKGFAEEAQFHYDRERYCWNMHHVCEKGALDEVIKSTLQRELGLHPNFGNALYRLARYLLRDEQLGLAAQALQASLEPNANLDPDLKKYAQRELDALVGTYNFKRR